MYSQLIHFINKYASHIKLPLIYRTKNTEIEQKTFRMHLVQSTHFVDFYKVSNVLNIILKQWICIKDGHRIWDSQYSRALLLKAHTYTTDKAFSQDKSLIDGP